MKKINMVLNKVLVIPYLYQSLRKRYSLYGLKKKSTQKVFTDIFTNNAWRGKDSVSGTGSDDSQTKIISQELRNLFNDLDISSILDIPCGDFHWMKNVDLSNVSYIGSDIVKELIQNNIDEYGSDGISFRHLNLIDSELPKVDLIFCRDCLIHLSYEDIFKALDNICNSQSIYILTTTFTDRQKNKDILTGQMRVINLEMAPFMFPKPIKIINEGCTEGDGIYKDKSMGFWRISDIRESLLNRHVDV